MKKIAILLLIVLGISVFGVGCGRSEGGGDAVNLTWYIMGSEQKDLKEVNEKINEITKEKINVTVDLKLLDWSAYDQKMNMIISTGEEFDLCWTAPQNNDYYYNVARGAFLPLDDLLKEHGQNTYSAIPERFWDATKINGEIYGALNYQMYATAYGYFVQKPLIDESGIDYASINSYKDLEPLLAYTKKNHPELIPLGTIQNRDPFSSSLPMYGFDPLGGTKVPGVVRFDDETLTVVNQYDTPEFKELITTMREWYNLGYIKPDATTNEEAEADFAANKVAVLFPGFLLSDSTEEAKEPDSGYYTSTIPYYGKKFTEPFITTDRVVATMTAISSTSKHPEEAMKLIELFNTDVELYNLICFGIEGKHYNKIDVINENNAHAEVELIENSGYWPNTAWMFGNLKNLKLQGNEKDHYNNWEKYNDSGVVSPTLGFAFDADPVANEMAMCTAVIDEYLFSLVWGGSDIDTRYPEFLEKLKASGVDKIIAEKQAQLNEWKKQK